MSATSSELQRTAEQMAQESFEERVDELATLAGDDLDALHDAMQDVRTTPRTAGTPEHIAFTLLAAAWRRVADGRRARTGL